MHQSQPIIDYSEVVHRLKADFGFKSVTSKFMSGGVCPSCKKKELFTDAFEPKGVKCSRASNCGHYETIRDLYPDLFENLTSKVPATEQDPNATAKAYLNHIRGFDLARMKGWYEQGVFYNAQTETGTATVKFFLDAKKTRYWERLIDFRKGLFKAKAHFAGKRKPDGEMYRGDWWAPPGTRLDPGRPLYMVEGIFDAISFEHCGYQARSLMTCYNFPTNELLKLDKGQVLIFALDNNKAGHDNAIKHVARAREMGFTAYAAFPESADLDWNDLYKKDGIDGFGKVLDNALWNGARMVAKTAGETAAIYVLQTRREYRVFQKGNAYWEAKFNRAKLEKDIGDKDDPEQFNAYFKRETFELIMDDVFISQIKSCTTLTKLSNCVAKFEYQQVDQYNDQDRLNYFEVSFENGSPMCTISIPGTALADSGSFNQALLRNTPGARFTGGKPHIEHLHEKVWFHRPAKEVKTINFSGYDKLSKTYVYNDSAFYNGKRYEINAQGFFDLKDAAIKTVNRDIRLKISNKFNPDKFMEHFQGAYAERGLIVLAWWVGSLFAEQLRGHFQGYPFFELQGQASSGKSTLIKILWKLFGREDYEGFNPLNSSFSAIDRNFAKTSNLPVVLIESDANDEQRNAKKFNWEHLKNAYTGEPLKERGVQNGGNETVFNPFRASLMAAQNTAIEGSEAILSRFIHLPLDRTHHLPGGKFHAETLARTEVEELSGFLPFMLRNENDFITKVIERAPLHYQGMSDLKIRIDRIKDNHAIVMAILETLIEYLPINHELAMNAFEMLRLRALKRQQDTQVDNPSVQALWDIYEYTNLQEDKKGLDLNARQIINHHTKDDYIAINLVHFEQVCKERGIKAPDMAEVKRHIRQTHRYKFEDYKVVTSAIFNNKSVRCFVFKKKRD